MAGSRNPSPPGAGRADRSLEMEDDIKKMEAAGYALNPSDSGSSVLPPKTKNGHIRLTSRDGDEEHGLERVTSQEVENAGTGTADGSVLEGEAVEYRVYKRRWFGLLQLTLLNIIVSWDWMTFGPVAQHAAEYYGTTETAVNWLSTGFLFAFAVAAPATIYTLHLGPKPSIVASAVLILVGVWVRYAGSHSRDGGSFGPVMFGQIITGFAQPFVLSAPTRYSDMWFTNRGRVAATALTSLANPFGAAVGQLVVPFMVMEPADMSNAVLYVAIISSVCVLPSFFIPAAPPTPPAPSGLTPKASLRASLPLLRASLEVWLLLIPFTIYVGLFNSISSLLNQILLPYGFSTDDAGIAGAVLIVVGLVASAIASPILDRTKTFVLAIKAFVPVTALCYLVFIWMPATRALAGPFVILALMGGSSFSLVPVALEFLCELSHPLSPEVTSTVAWAGGQVLGGIFIVVSDALRAGDEADPPRNLDRALVFHAVIAIVAVVPPLALGLFGRQDRLVMKRVKSDESRRGLR